MKCCRGTWRAFESLLLPKILLLISSQNYLPFSCDCCCKEWLLKEGTAVASYAITYGITEACITVMCVFGSKTSEEWREMLKSSCCRSIHLPFPSDFIFSRIFLYHPPPPALIAPSRVSLRLWCVTRSRDKKAVEEELETKDDESQMLSKEEATSKIIFSCFLSLNHAFSSCDSGRLWSRKTHWPFVRRKQVSFHLIIVVTSVSDSGYFVILSSCLCLQLPRSKVEGTARQVLHGLSRTWMCKRLFLVHSRATSKCPSFSWKGCWIGSREYFPLQIYLCMSITLTQEMCPLQQITPILKGRMMNAGTLMISYQPQGDIPNFFRNIVSNPGAQHKDIDFLVAELDRLGKDL